MIFTWCKNRIIQSTSNFFCGSRSGQSNVNEPLLRIMELHPSGAIYFIKIVMLSSTTSALFVGILCYTFLSEWDHCGVQNKRLRLWNIGHCVLQLIQTPLRTVFFLRLQGKPLHLVQDEIKSMATSMAWKVSKILSIISYGWFILGVVWLMNAKCPSCPALFRLTLSIIGIWFARLVITLACFYNSFPVQIEEKPGRVSATKDEIECLVTTRIEGGGCDACAICLSDFEQAQVVRHLPCTHFFHTKCVDRWLRRHRICPLCLHDITKEKKRKTVWYNER